MPHFTILAHLSYLALTSGLTIWVARTLFGQGRFFLKDAFGGDAAMSLALSCLLQMGFYLLAFGFIIFFLRAGAMPASFLGVIEQVSTKVGTVLIMLALMHFGNLFNFAKIRRKGRRAQWATEQR